MNSKVKKCFLLLLWSVFIAINVFTEGLFGGDPDSGVTKVVLLGTGTPNPDPNHSGCSVAIIVNEVPYLVDFGPGVVRQAASLSPRYGDTIQALEVKNIKTVFLSTSTYELGEIASQIKPDLLILYHILFWGAAEEDLLKEISEKYKGKVIVGSDLTVFE